MYWALYKKQIIIIIIIIIIYVYLKDIFSVWKGHIMNMCINAEGS